MSEIYTIVAVVLTFAAVLVGGVAFSNSYTERTRTLRRFQDELANTSPDLRQEELSLSFNQRVIQPLGTGLANLGRRFTPNETRTRITRLLELAGNPGGWDAERISALKVFALVALGMTALILAGIFDLSTRVSLAVLLAAAAAGYFLPNYVLAKKGERRQVEIRKALSDTFDLLTVSVEAGLGFDAALTQVVRRIPGVLSEELSRMLNEVQLGVPRSEAMRDLAARTDVEELSGFVLSMVQADEFGVSVTAILRAQTKELRVRRRQMAEMQAMKLPVKLVFPMVLCTLPALFTVILGPGAIRIFDAFKDF